MKRTLIAWTCLLAAPLAAGAEMGQLIEKLNSPDPRVRAEARQLVHREDPAVAVPMLIPMLASADSSTSALAAQIIADLCNEASAPGREQQRAAAAWALVGLLDTKASAEVKLRVLRLIPVAAAPGMDLGPVVGLLRDPVLGESARTALEETATPEARVALLWALEGVAPERQAALLSSLAAMKDLERVSIARRFATEGPPVTVAAAVRLLAVAADPADLEIVRQAMRRGGPANLAETFDAYLRYVAALAEKGGNWELAVAEYKGLLKSSEAKQAEAGFAGLARIGDGSCVPTILERMGTCEGATLLIGAAALRAIPGVDATRALVEAYPKQKPAIQTVLIPVLGSRKHPLVAPLLVQAAGAGEPAMRAAALEALAESGLPDAGPVLVKAAQSGSDAEKPVARAGLLRIAESLRAAGKAKEAGPLYVHLINLADAKDTELRGRLLEGLAACPAAEGYEIAKGLAADTQARELALRVLIGVAGRLTEAGAKDKALELYNLALPLQPSKEQMQALATGMHAAGAKVDLQGLLGTITNWWVVGPFELGAQNEGWNVAYVDEPNVDLVGRYMTGKRRVEWKPLASKEANGLVNLRANLADTDNAIGYAYTEVTVKEAADAVLLLGVDDSERVWVNGEKVFELWVARGLTPDQDRIPIKLKAGKNTILLKVWQNTLGWEFTARLTLPDGRPVVFEQKPIK